MPDLLTAVNKDERSEEHFDIQHGDMEMWSLEFVHLIFGLALVQYFLILMFRNGKFFSFSSDLIEQKKKTNSLGPHTPFKGTPMT